MNSIPCSKLLPLALLLGLPWAALAQNAVVTISSPSPKVLVGGQLQLTGSIADVVGTPIDSSGLAWSSSDATIASVSSKGLVSASMPGDVSVTLADSSSGASATFSVHSIPSSISIVATPSVIRAGDSARVSAVAFDINGQQISGVVFRYQSAEPFIARVQSDGGIFGVAEGLTTIEASIPAAYADPSLVATTQIQILPAAVYNVKKILSSDVPSTTTIAAYSTLASESANEVGSIVTLANGGQAAVLIENSRPKVLAVVGQSLPNTGLMVLRLDAISANSKGDVALLVEYPSQWCAAYIVLFPHNQPEHIVGPANCGNGIRQRSLAEDQSVMVRANYNGLDQIGRYNADGSFQSLFSVAGQPAMQDPIRTLNDFAPSPAGTFILNVFLVSGAHVYLYSNGKSLTQVYKDGDILRSQQSVSMDLPIGAADGSFYARVNGGNFEALQQLAPGTPKTLAMTNDTFGGARLGWIHYVMDASSGGVLLLGDLSAPSYHTGILVWKTSLAEYLPVSSSSSMFAGAIPSSGAPVFSAILPSDTGGIPLRSLASAMATPAVLLASGAPFPQPAPVGIDWHVAPRGAGPAGLISRGAGDAVVKVADGSSSTLLTVGAPLPNGKLATWIGAVSGNQVGDAVFTAGYPTGSMLVRYRAGKLETFADTAISKGPNNTSPTYFFNYRGRYLAMNGPGDVVSVAGYSNNLQQIVLNASDGPHLVAQQRQSAPGGSTFTNFGNVAIDENSHVLFSSNLANGSNAVFFWDGNALRRIIGTGDMATSGLIVNEVSNTSGGGSGFLIMLALGGYQTRELRYFDGQGMRTVESSDTSVFDTTGLNYFWTNECTLSGNGEAHCQAATQDGGSGVYAHRNNGSDSVVARTRDPMPGGEWLIMPLVVNSSLTGEVYFTADTWFNGVEALALYKAAPR